MLRASILLALSSLAVANVAGWVASPNDTNAGTGNYGTCCSEMDIWEANVNAEAYTPHPCSVTGQTRCSGTDCGQGDNRYAGVCDADGCDFNSYRMGDTTFLGKGQTVDTSQKITVVTQFITSTNTSSGSLSEIRRIYVQNGKVIQNSNVNIAGVDAVNSITDNFCAQQKTAFGDQNYFATKGGLKTLGTAMSTGMVLALSIWDDHTADMLWLDSSYPPTKSASSPGVTRGPCAASSGDPKTVESASGSASVTYSNIKFGDIGSTYTGSTTGTGSTSGSGSSTSSTGSTGGTAAHYAQCGGIGYSGATSCVSPYTCTVVNSYYSQCL
ncbi:carbohydrate-binding module family 1 protein [Auriscalpium vulgare]|uniref:Carbohydrate-binding module family 1 protein n=1 Tax=Auriscalpium vulgare TaxID=40419 RepID=A0ACB8S739_9AGAM|nr:carbohydrate-binding module family 1 protein [Auriscalpium vulgare]